MEEHRRRQYLREIGVVSWERRNRGGGSIESDGESRFPVQGEAGTSRIFDVSKNLVDLSEDVARCRACSLHIQRQNTVFGCGSGDADWLFVGEAPGAEEDKQGQPFVGRAGQLLNSILFSIGLTREAVYIANVLKCRPPGNRDPMGEEVLKCEPYLHEQIKNVQPVIIIAMGRFAAQSLLKTTSPIGLLRGRPHEYPGFGIPLIVTYHPAYLLRSPLEKKKVWSDLLLAQAVVRESRDVS